MTAAEGLLETLLWFLTCCVSLHRFSTPFPFEISTFTSCLCRKDI